MFSRLANECAKEGLWLRAILELGSTYGWREAELPGMRVSQVDLAQRIIRLEPGTTKNDEGREVEMTPAVFVLLTALMAGKEPEEYVFPREDGTPVREFAGTGGGLAQRLV
jgi:integrase